MPKKSTLAYVQKVINTPRRVRGSRATHNKAVHIYSIFKILLSNLINNPHYPTKHINS
jgi:hypothetical protein